MQTFPHARYATPSIFELYMVWEDFVLSVPFEERSRLWCIPTDPAQVTVTLRSAGNPDFGQDPEHPVPGVPYLTAEVDSLTEASDVCRQYIDTYELGGGNWTGGAVYQDGRQIAHISYNGRIWTDPAKFRG